MKEQMFRKSSIDRISAPEQLNEYIRVANPSVWLTLAAVVLLLFGTLAWGIFGRVETTVNAVIEVSNGVVTGYVPAQAGGHLEAGMRVSVGKTEGTVAAISDVPVQMGNDTEPYVFYLGDFSQGDFCYRIQFLIDGLSDGVYEAQIVVDSVAPIQFVIQ